MHILVLQHVSFEGPAMIRDWANHYGHRVQVVYLYQEGQALPDLDAYDMLVIMGGPMSVHDEMVYPWLAPEKDYIRAALDAGIYVLGICLGAQLIAQQLGADITPATKEIGWFPITLTDCAADHPLCAGLDKAFSVFHWHGEQFRLPPNALHIASSEACPYQAFVYQDRVLGLQFHLEMDEAAIEAILTHCAADIQDGTFTQQAGSIKEQSRSERTRPVLYKLLNQLVELP